MMGLLLRLARALAVPSGRAGPSPAALTPLVPFPMLDGGVLACADLAPHLAALPDPARRRRPGA
ncbi:hypothetical protein [Methylobacterium soli]|uniref:Uncharacterized protein n=1 Tax=Methylobacterium soli TaxID=553447 RepID=A0A6L3SRE5_9HYPH|nr:hypothetical protein [Methylobacterium soli]KAB1074970.1 hypothetical protein F6X53_25290 [Methylobacterium soli]